jgi:hypothetical protein
MKSEPQIDTARTPLGLRGRLRAIDESTATGNERFAKLGSPQAEASLRHCNRAAHRGECTEAMERM